MKIEVSQKELKIITKALRQRVEDLSRFSRDCEMQGKKACMIQFAEMANEADEVLDKLDKYIR